MDGRREPHVCRRLPLTDQLINGSILEEDRKFSASIGATGLLALSFAATVIDSAAIISAPPTR